MCLNIGEPDGVVLHVVSLLLKHLPGMGFGGMEGKCYLLQGCNKTNPTMFQLPSNWWFGARRCCCGVSIYVQEPEACIQIQTTPSHFFSGLPQCFHPKWGNRIPKGESQPSRKQRSWHILPRVASHCFPRAFQKAMHGPVGAAWLAHPDLQTPHLDMLLTSSREKPRSMGVLFGCFGRKIDAPGLPGGLIIYQGYPSISHQCAKEP